MRDAEAVTFAGGRLDRAARLRGDPRALAELAQAPGARCLPLWRGKPLFDTVSGMGLAWLPTGHPILMGARAEAFLGLAPDGPTPGGPRFAREIDWEGPDGGGGPPAFVDENRARHPGLPEHLAFAELRAVMGAIDAEEAGTAAAAKGILGWHETHGFCARCGAPTASADGGWKRVCAACGAQHFPRTDPVVIMLILRGEETLLGRSPGWPPGMYSLLAGFMEPGESIEAAVRRETWEEAGVRVGAVDYLASQPWPFPSGLMIGCRGVALTREIARDPVELEDARWVDREGVLAGLMGRDPEMRPARKGSIARFLLERWLADRLG